MRNIRKLLVILFVLSLAQLIFPPLARGENGVDQKAIQQLIQKTRQEISRQKRQEKSVLNQLVLQQKKLSNLENNYQAVKTNLGNVQGKVNQTRKELVGLQKSLSALEMNLGAQQRVLNQRLLTIYKRGPQTYLEIIFGAEDFADLVSRFDSVAYFVKQDLMIVARLEQTKIAVGQHKIAVQQKKTQVESEYRKISVLRDQLAGEQQKITAQVGNTKEALQKIQSNRAQLEKALDEYEQTSREIEASIRRKEQQNPGRTLGTGSMIWPARGPISSGFGWRYHPILKAKKLHNGQDIAIPQGTPVHAADAGIVVVSGWRGGYGNFVAIDHGNGISSCYGHNSRLLVREGDKVYKGQVISYSGNTGLSTGPHLHFEVRKNGVPVNPLRYLP